MNTIITIGRERGSGGKRIGEKLASYYGIPFYDKELLEKAAGESGLCKEIFEHNDEKPTNSFLYSLVMGTYAGGGYAGNLINDMPLNQKVFLAQFDVIKKIAEEGPCVIIGRCADYALEMNPNCLSVFIHANIETRIKRIANENQITNVKAREMILPFSFMSEVHVT